jgi:hypothetical protein
MGIGIAAMLSLPIGLSIGLSIVQAFSHFTLGIMVLGMISFVLAQLNQIYGKKKFLAVFSLLFSTVLILWCAYFAKANVSVLWLLMFLPLQAGILFHGRLRIFSAVLAISSPILYYGGFKNLLSLDFINTHWASIVVAVIGLGICTYVAGLLQYFEHQKNKSNLGIGVIALEQLKQLEPKAEIFRDVETENIQPQSKGRKMRKITPVPANSHGNLVYLDNFEEKTAQIMKKTLNSSLDLPKIEEILQKLEVEYGTQIDKSA